MYKDNNMRDIHYTADFLRFSLDKLHIIWHRRLLALVFLGAAITQSLLNSVLQQNSDHNGNYF